jgi:mutator protein MutT
MKSAEFTIQVAVALIQQDGKYLIARRFESAPLGGYWEFPGGKCRLGEGYEECVKRELREEMGVDVEVLGLYRTIDHASPDQIVQLYFYHCRIISGEPQALGAQEIRWAKREELGQYTFPPANESLVQDLMSEKLNP